MTKIKQLDFFRFLAAIIVIFLHQGKNTTWYNSLPSIFHQGQLMVLFFFVLSGFVLTYRYYNENINLKKYYISRLNKLIPLYYFSLFLFFIFNPISINKIPYALLGIQSLIPSKALLFNYPTWALSAEFIFILLFPYLIKFYKHIQIKNFVIITLIYSIIVYSIYLLLVPFYDNIFIREFLIYNPLMHLPVFLLGMITFYFYKKSGLKNNSLVIILILFFISLLSKFSNRYFPIYIIIGGYLFSLFIYFLSTDNSFISKILSNNFFYNLGALSYPMFLFHIPIAYFFIKIFNFNFDNSQYLIYLFSTIFFSEIIIVLQKKCMLPGINIFKIVNINY